MPGSRETWAMRPASDHRRIGCRSAAEMPCREKWPSTTEPGLQTVPPPSPRPQGRGDVLAGKRNWSAPAALLQALPGAAMRRLEAPCICAPLAFPDTPFGWDKSRGEDVKISAGILQKANSTALLRLTPPAAPADGQTPPRSSDRKSPACTPGAASRRGWSRWRASPRRGL